MDYILKKVKADEIKKLYNLSTWVYEERLVREIFNKERDIYVISDNGKFIAECTVLYESDSELKTKPNERVYLTYLRVHEDYQNKGLSKQLCSYIVNDLIEKGYKEFTAASNSDKLKHIFSSLGFSETIDKVKDKFEGKVQEYDLLLLKINW